MKKLLIATLILLGYGFYLYERAQDRKTDGFYVERIAPIFPDDPKWDITPKEMAFSVMLL
jgi:hypothetical protein